MVILVTSFCIFVISYAHASIYNLCVGGGVGVGVGKGFNFSTRYILIKFPPLTTTTSHTHQIFRNVVRDILLSV